MNPHMRLILLMHGGKYAISKGSIRVVYLNADTVKYKNERK